MKKKIIRISDISQVDTSKISVYDLNNRYIDQLGHIYGLKYNRMLKKVEIIKLERIHNSEMQQYQRKIIQARELENQFNIPVDHGTNDALADAEDIYFEPEVFIDSVITDSAIHRERLSGIMMNIDSADIFTRENKSESTVFDDLARHIEIDCIQQLDKLENYYRELVNYPRSITYYQAKMDNEGKIIIDSMTGKKENIMRFIFLYEMSSTIKRVYGNLKKHTKSLEEFVEDKNPDEIPGISKFQKQAFLDAKTSISNTIGEVDEVLRKNKKLYEYAVNKKNFSK